MAGRVFASLYDIAGKTFRSKVRGGARRRCSFLLMQWEMSRSFRYWMSFPVPILSQM